MRTTIVVIILALASAVALPARTHPLDQADLVVVTKSERKLVLMKSGKVLKTYSVALGGSPTGAKEREGDHRTPEGTYVLDSRNAKSRFYRSLHISSPNAEDRAHAQKLRVAAGGDVFIHGLPNGYGYIGAAHRLHDWTDGCIAVTNSEMDEIWRLVPNGTRIEIKP